MNARLLNEVEAFLEREAVRDQPVLVAVSGGPDSVALLHAVHGRAARRNLQVIAGHLNHQLRGNESDADEAFVEELCRQYRLPLYVERANIRAAAQEQRENLEAVARRYRYEWLAQLARQHGAPWLATGHTADDQAETVLHHLIRGTGLRGLRGIAPRRLLAHGVEVIRPLLRVERRNVLAHLEEHDLAARQDTSNLDLALTRNRIRHELIPFLQQQFQADVVASLCRLAEQAAHAYGLLEQQAKALLLRAEKPKAGDLIILDAQALAASERHLVREVLHLIWEREGWPLDGMSFKDWERVADLVLGAGTAHDLPGEVHARRKDRVLQLRGQESGVRSRGSGIRSQESEVGPS